MVKLLESLKRSLSVSKRQQRVDEPVNSNMPGESTPLKPQRLSLTPDKALARAGSVSPPGDRLRAYRGNEQAHSPSAAEAATGRSLFGSPASSRPARPPALQSRLAKAGLSYGIAHDDSGHPSGSDENIKVVVRVRPINGREQGLGSQRCTVQLSDQSVKIMTVPEPHTYTFDAVAGEPSSQEQIFQIAGWPVVQNALAGYNSCIFAYGQTGAGKSFTMQGPAADGGSPSQSPRDDLQGLTPRVFQHLFQSITERTSSPEKEESLHFLCKCSFLEIYNETITDLLSLSDSNLHIREDIKQGVYVEGLVQEEVTNVEEAMQILYQGTAKRRVAQTNINRESSRSHSVLTCSVESKATDANGITNILHARLNLVDLAGSERQKESGASGERLREASSINKSLSTLGHVIMALIEQQRGVNRHVPFRDSKLTFLLQDSLGGNSKTFMIANISPASACLAETLSTLRFAQRAKDIRNKAVVNEDTSGDAALLRVEVQRLKEELASYKNDNLLHKRLVPGGAALTTPLRASSPGSILGFRTPVSPSMRLPTSPSSAQGTQSSYQALIGALRREQGAVAHVKRLQAELHGTEDVIRRREMDVQRSKMIIRLKEDKIARMQVAALGHGPEDAGHQAELDSLQQEISLLRLRVENHPEVRKFAVENLRLREEVQDLQREMEADEVNALRADLDAMRLQALQTADQLRQLQSTPVVRNAEAAAAKAAYESSSIIEEAMAQAAAIVKQAEQDAQAKSKAQEAKRLEAQRVAVENERMTAELATASQDKTELQAQVVQQQQEIARLKMLQLDMEQQASAMRQQLDFASGMTADLQASQERVEQLQAEVQQLREVTADQEAAAAAEQELRSRADASIAELETQLQQAQLQYSQEAAAAQQLRLDLVDEKQRAQSMNATLQASVESATAEAVTMEHRRQEEAQATMREELEMQCNLAADVQKQLQQELDGSRSQRGHLEQELIAMQQQLADNALELQLAERAHEEEVQQLQQQRQDLTSLLEGRDSGLQQVQVQLGHAEEQRAKLAEDIAAREGLVASLQQRLAGNESELKAAMDQRSAAVLDASKAHGEVLNWKSKYEDHIHMQQALSGGEVDGQTRLSTITAELTAEREMQAELHTRIAQLNIDNTALKKQARELRRQSSAQASATPRAPPQSPAMPTAAETGLVEELTDLRARHAASTQQVQAAEQQRQAAIAQAKDLVQERETWLHQLQEHRCAISSARSQLEAQQESVLELQAQITQAVGDAAKLRQQEAELEQQVTKLTGQNNINQRIQHHQKVKDENNFLKAELAAVRQQNADNAARLKRTLDELAPLRAASGKSATPDLDEEDMLRARLATLTADQQQLSSQLSSLSAAVLDLAASAQNESQAEETSPSAKLRTSSPLRFKQDGDSLPSSDDGAGSWHIAAGGRGVQMDSASKSAHLASQSITAMHNAWRHLQQKLADKEHQLLEAKERSRMQTLKLALDRPAAAESSTMR